MYDVNDCGDYTDYFDGSCYKLYTHDNYPGTIVNEIGKWYESLHSEGPFIIYELGVRKMLLKSDPLH